MIDSDLQSTMEADFGSKLRRELWLVTRAAFTNSLRMYVWGRLRADLLGPATQRMLEEAVRASTSVQAFRIQAKL